MKGICKNAEGTELLTEGTTYYLFPNGDSHVYASRFDNQDAHFGCFQTELFEEVNTAEETEPPPLREPLELDTYYSADLIWRRPGYKNLVDLGSYVIYTLDTHAYFYDDETLKGFRGCFPIHWFSNFKPITINQEEVTEEAAVKEEFAQMEQLSLF